MEDGLEPSLQSGSNSGELGADLNPDLDISRFLNPKSVATFGGGWAANVIQQLQKSGYQGDIWPIHPSRSEICGIRCYPDLASVPGTPDASFIGVNRHQTIEVVRQLSARNAGGAICFASGFKESDQFELQAQLLQAAGKLPILGPNCYGFVNYLDNVCLWPDQHGGKPVDSGVAIIAQSSNVSINMSMQQRGLSLAYLFTVGNQAQIGVSAVARHMIDDPRVNVIGLYLEGFDDIRSFERLAAYARSAGKQIVVLKIGKSQKARSATISHTASLAGSAAASSALLHRLGMLEVDSVSEFLETLTLLNGIGPLAGPTISSVSCSGGEASLMSELALGSDIVFPDYNDSQQQRLADVLGPRVELANPLDYHTYIWGDAETMTACFEIVMQSNFDLNVFVLDLPREDICDPIGHECAVASIIAAKQNTAANVAVIALLPENLNEAISERFQAAGIVPQHDMLIGLAAIDAAIRAGQLQHAVSAQPEPVLLKQNIKHRRGTVLSEYAAKTALRRHGLNVPESCHAMNKDEVLLSASQLKFPLVLKGQGIAHKTEAGAVVLGIDSETALKSALRSMPDFPDGYLLEEMVTEVVAELLLGISFDETGLCMLTIGAGGIFAELLADTATLLLPSSRSEVQQAIQSLKVANLLNGYRGKPAANLDSVVDAVTAIAQYAIQNHEQLEELDINPLMVGCKQSVVVDALIRLRS